MAGGEFSARIRDRAVLGVLAYTGARVGTVAKLRLSDYRITGEQRTLRFREKSGKVRHDLEGWLNEYIDAARKGSPLFRAADGKRKHLTGDTYAARSAR